MVVKRPLIKTKKVTIRKPTVKSTTVTVKEPTADTEPVEVERWITSKVPHTIQIPYSTPEVLVYDSVIDTQHEATV